MFSFVIVNLTNGYVKNLSPVEPFNNDRKRSYFHFDLQTEDDETRVVSFSPEKHKLLEKIQNQDTGCELKRFPLNSKNEIIINDYTSVREVQPNFQKIEKKRQFVTIAHINDESELYDIVNVTGIIYNLETLDKIEKKIHLLKATLQDKTDDIPISIFGDLVNQINNEGMTVTLTDLRVSKYMTTRLLKSTDTTTFQVSDKEMSIDLKNLRDTNSKSITATIVSVD